MPTRPARTASYPVSVRQVTALLHASLEPCLTAALLRFANTSPPSGCVEDLTSAELSRSLTSKLSNMLGTPKKADPAGSAALEEDDAGTKPCCLVSGTVLRREIKVCVPII